MTILIWKRLLAAALAGGCLLLLGGCLNPVQLNERAIVQAVGLDWEDGGIRMTLQIFSPAGDGSGISGASDNAKLISTHGKTVSEAVQNAMLTQGKQLFMGHNRIVIIGVALAKRGLEQPLSYFSANAWSRQNIHLAVAEGRAADILSARINQGILPAETLEKISENAEENGISQNIRLFEFLTALESEHESSVLPVIRIQAESPGAASSDESVIEEISRVEMAGMAVFSGAKLTGILTSEQSRGLLWIRNAVRRTVVVVSTDRYEAAALQIYRVRSHLTPQLHEDDAGPHISFLLQISCDAALGESLLRPGAALEPGDIDKLGEAAGTVIKREAAAAFRTVSQDYRADVFELGSMLWRYDAELWSRLREEWTDSLPQIALQIEAKVNIDRTGLEFKSEG